MTEVIRKRPNTNFVHQLMGEFADMKPIYDMLSQQLKPMGFELDMDELQKARPVIAMMLQ